MRIFDVLSGCEKSLNFQEPIGIYVCGVTTYDHCHLGHALPAIYFDALVRYLRACGAKVTYVRNYTDVDDKIIARAGETALSPLELSAAMILSAEEDMASLGCRPPDFAPRVSLCIPEIIKMIQELVVNGAAYVTDAGDVYYRVRAKSDYGKLSRRPLEGKSVRQTLGDGKEEEEDFALWKADQHPGASWDSPWSRGRPGWHIECSAMSRKHLGASFEIHGGGRDLIFPHHENEIAQSESANGCTYADIWMHVGLLTINDQKMSKSLGNHLSIKDFLRDWHPEVLRLILFQHHYRSNINFDEKSFLAATIKLFYFYETFDRLPDCALDTSVWVEAQAILANDFNTAALLGVWNQYFASANEKKVVATTWSKIAGVRMCGQQLGLFCSSSSAFQEETRVKYLQRLGWSNSRLEEKITTREILRSEKKFDQADLVRAELLSEGIELLDYPGKTVWRPCLANPNLT